MNGWAGLKHHVSSRVTGKEAAEDQRSTKQDPALEPWRLNEGSFFLGGAVVFIDHVFIHVFDGKSDNIMANQSSAANFQIVPFFSNPKDTPYIFTALLTIYLLGLLINMIIITVIYSDRRLHTPMYLFLCNLSIIDICFSTVIIPKVLYTLLTGIKTVSFIQCFTQFFFYVLFGTSEDTLLFVMAYDRYVAICRPLYYSQILSKKSCFGLIVGIWSSACMNSLLITVQASKLTFCSTNKIHHLFCDFKALFKISCGGLEKFFNLVYFEILVFVFFPFLFSFVSYIKIITIILHIKSHEGRRKVFSTCSSHLTVLLLYYTTASSVILAPNSKYSDILEQSCSVLYTTVTPMLNPLIYTLRNKEVKNALWRLMKAK
ncbi:olfactory receptor 1L4-like [Dendropsophus ebraccatus]|uniref:olfactory receptor 1L4-like n=1 Tax=Dendropsophus ebraccatus TaxID=150705 RepID=UPI003831B527